MNFRIWSFQQPHKPSVDQIKGGVTPSLSSRLTCSKLLVFFISVTLNCQCKNFSFSKNWVRNVKEQPVTMDSCLFGEKKGGLLFIAALRS